MKITIVIEPDEPDFVSLSSEEGQSWASSNGIRERIYGEPVPMLTTAMEMLSRYALRRARRDGAVARP